MRESRPAAGGSLDAESRPAPGGSHDHSNDSSSAGNPTANSSSKYS